MCFLASYHPRNGLCYVKKGISLTFLGLVSKVERLFCSRYNEDDEQDDEEDGGEDPYEFSLSAVIDECARMASQDDPTNPGSSSSGSSQSKKRKIIQSSYFSDEEDED